MVGLLDIVPATEKVPLGGKDVELGGLGADGIAILLTRFPEIRKLLTGVEVTEADVIKVAPSAISSIIAAGAGLPGDEAAEKVAAKLGIEDQVVAVEAIWRMTFPNGIGPFVDKLQRMGIIPSDESGKAPDTKLQQPSKS